MGGLTSTEINNKLTVEKTTPETKQLILDFLNNSETAADIAGIDSTGGTASGIDVKTAQDIINKRKTLGKFTDLTQLSSIDSLSIEKLGSIIHFPILKGVIAIVAIEFNINTASFTNDAMNIRKNFTTAAPSPAWQNGVSIAYADSPALYSIKETLGQTLAIKARFKGNLINAAHIRATCGGALGDVKERLVLFNPLGDSRMVTFQLENTTFHANGISEFNIDWQWQWRLNSLSPWKNLKITKHRIFVILQAPTLPWNQVLGSTSLPWTDALEISCKWAGGAKTTDQAATLITQKYNSCGVVSYDIVQGATYYGVNSYMLTSMINRLNGGPGLGSKVNCTDSADTVVTFANLLGCDLWESRMGWSFRCNEIIAIGYNNWAVPFGWGFSYHEIPWKGACTQNDNIFDGCLKVDGDADPTTPPRTPLLPTNMLFG